MSRFLLTDVPLVVLVLGVLAVLLLLRKGLWLLRLRPTRRQQLNRILPAAEVVTALLYVIWVATLFVPEDQGYIWVLAGVLVLGILGAGWFSIKDVVSGVVLRAEHGYRPGQWIQAGEVEGLIQHVGYRALALETETGLQVHLPYSQLSTTSVVTAAHADTSRAHTFRLEVSNTRPAAEVMAGIRAAALTVFWSSVKRAPYVQLGESSNGRQVFQVTVYALDEAYVADIEQAVRRQFNTA